MIRVLRQARMLGCGHRFTFALVELAVYQVSASSRIIVPSVLAQTMLIERGVVRVESDAVQGVKVEITELPTSPTIGPPPRPISIGEDEFFEALEQKQPKMPEALRALLAKAEVFGVYPEFQSALNLKHVAPEGEKPLNMGTIKKDGTIDTGPSTWFGRGEAGGRYNETLVTAVGGQIKASNYQGEETGVRTAAGKMPRVSDFLPHHERLWLDAMSRCISDICDQQESRTSDGFT